MNDERKIARNEPFNEFRMTPSGTALRQGAVNHIRMAYNIGHDNGAATERERILDTVKKMLRELDWDDVTLEYLRDWLEDSLGT